MNLYIYTVLISSKFWSSEHTCTAVPSSVSKCMATTWCRTDGSKVSEHVFLWLMFEEISEKSFITTHISGLFYLNDLVLCSYISTYFWKNLLHGCKFLKLFLHCFLEMVVVPSSFFFFLPPSVVHFFFILTPYVSGGKLCLNVPPCLLYRWDLVQIPC